MNCNPPNTLYRHSGKFTPHGLLLALVGVMVAMFPLGYLYAYLIKWVPFIYINVFITAGYGFLCGCVSGFLLRLGRTRNNYVAVCIGLLGSLAGVYFNWMGHICATFESSPALCSPSQILFGMKQLYENGSWSVRGYTFTGFPLGAAWGAEALIIIGLGTLAAYVMISNTPFCEQNQCWLNQEKKIETLEAFVEPDQIALLKSGDTRLLEHPKAKAPGASQFARLTLKYSPKCEEFCTLSIGNVTVSVDAKGRTKEVIYPLMKDVVLPKKMFDILSKLEGLKPDVAPPPMPPPHLPSATASSGSS